MRQDAGIPFKLVVENPSSTLPLPASATLRCAAPFRGERGKSYLLTGESPISGAPFVGIMHTQTMPNAEERRPFRMVDLAGIALDPSESVELTCKVEPIDEAALRRTAPVTLNGVRNLVVGEAPAVELIEGESVQKGPVPGFYFADELWIPEEWETVLDASSRKVVTAEGRIPWWADSAFGPLAARPRAHFEMTFGPDGAIFEWQLKVFGTY